MERGTNPLIILNLHTDLDLSTVRTARVVVSSEAETHKIAYDNITIDSEEKTATFQMSQEDTLSFYPGKIKIQLRIKFQNGSVKASKIIKTNLYDCLEDVVI